MINAHSVWGPTVADSCGNGVCIYTPPLKVARPPVGQIHFLATVSDMDFINTLQTFYLIIYI